MVNHLTHCQQWKLLKNITPHCGKPCLETTKTTDWDTISEQLLQEIQFEGKVTICRN